MFRATADAYDRIYAFEDDPAEAARTTARRKVPEGRFEPAGRIGRGRYVAR